MNGVNSRLNSTGNIENMRAIRTLPARYARHTHAQRVCWINGVGKMHRWLAQLQKLAENEHFLCKGRSDILGSPTRPEKAPKSRC